MSERSGDLSVVARRRLDQLLEESARRSAATVDPDPRLVGAAPLEAGPVEVGPSATGRVDAGDSVALADEYDWVQQLRSGGAGNARPVNDASTPAQAAPSAAQPDVQPGGLPGQVPDRPVTWVTSALLFTKEHLVTVVVVLVVGIAWTGYSLFQVRTTPVADAVPRVESAPSGSVSASGQPSAAASSAAVVVHVIGAVRRPGVYRLAEGSRVADAIAAAGGMTAAAAPGELNLAQVLSDGTQLKLGTTKHPGGWLRVGEQSGGAAPGGAAESTSTKLSINTATEAQLDTLPGIGPVTAAKIVAWRTEHGKFNTVTELQEVDGIGPKTYADLAERVRL